MCGFVGNVGVRSALDAVRTGLARVERSWHDSSGVAVLASDRAAPLGEALDVAEPDGDGEGHVVMRRECDEVRWETTDAEGGVVRA